MNEATSIVKVRSLAAKPGKACFLALAAIVLIPPQQLAAAPFSNALQSVIDGAQQEGTLDLYAPSTLKPGRARALRQGIKDKYGVDLDVVYNGVGLDDPGRRTSKSSRCRHSSRWASIRS
ncbi:MAG: hypothetical protein A3G25_13105 [Betaproteobacteria bacterium RIFCSPLOWO2_12_FULL_63_13]|nr:MAG: hypothetical protein A3G25_13105 [Betaproteobacteria bacterium RIFCSPLOWO2_12_FULL_63_13]